VPHKPNALPRAGNDSLLQLYGFVEAGNPHDSYTLLDPWARLQQVVGQVPAEVVAALQQGCGLQALQRPLALGPGSWPDRDAVAALEQLLQALRSSGRQHAPQQASGLQLLQDLVSSELGCMGSNLQQDTELLEGLRRLPGLQAQRGQLELQLQEASRQHAAVLEQQRRLREAQLQEVPGEGGAGAAAAAAAAAEAEDPEQSEGGVELVAQLQALEEARQEVLRQLEVVLSDEQHIEALQQQSAGVPLLALQLRVEKKRMLQALCSSSSSSSSS
jgi:hypothetical protein